MDHRASRMVVNNSPLLDRDARDSLAAIELVLAQLMLGSQLIDNVGFAHTSW